METLPATTTLRVLTWDGHLGTIVGVTADGWVRVRLDSERGVTEWQPSQLSEVAS